MASKSNRKVAERLPAAEHPSHWSKGQLLDVKRYTDGSYCVTLFGESARPDMSNALSFDSSYAAQQFVSAWYQPTPGRM